MRFELFIARRYLRAKRRQAFIGIITGISVAGVAAGVASLVVALAINNGFRQDLQQRLLGATSHISLQRVGDLLNSVKVGSAEALEDSRSPGSQSSVENSHVSQKRRGMGHPADATPTESPDSLTGVHARVAAMPPIVLGKDMAENLGARVGDVVLVTSPQGELTPFGMVPKYNRFRVVGIFNSGFFDYDSSWAFTRLSDAQRLF